ncbi:MAG: carbonic anhydrase family protein [Chitinophagales bacterium]
MKSLLPIITLALLLSSCNNTATKQVSTQDSSKAQLASHPVLVEKVLTKEERDALTPDQILQSLKDGNNRFVNDSLTDRLHSAQVRAAAKGQYPKAVILSCLDSRIPVEDVFDKGIGDLFVARVAGNIVDEDILGSMEFGCKVSGAKLIVVLGHTECGAIKGAIDNVQLGNLTALLSKIKPAVDSTQSFSGDKTSKNKDYVNAVCNKNVQLTINNIRKHSPILNDMEKNGEIKIVGAVYDMATGKVTFM